MGQYFSRNVKTVFHNTMWCTGIGFTSALVISLCTGTSVIANAPMVAYVCGSIGAGGYLSWNNTPVHVGNDNTV